MTENISEFLIFTFVFEIRPILFPYTLLWEVQATPNQHLLTLPSSPVGKSPGLHAGVQQFKPHSGHKVSGSPHSNQISHLLLYPSFCLQKSEVSSHFYHYQQSLLRCFLLLISNITEKWLEHFMSLGNP